MNGMLSLGERYLAVRQRIQRAAEAAGRDPQTIRLLAVSKSFPAGSIRELAGAGQLAFGENYLQEALGKIAALTGAGLQDQEAALHPVADPALHPAADPAADPALDPAPGPALRRGPLSVHRPAAPQRLEWHFIGPIQSNKTRRIAEAFDWVQSVEQERIARRLSEQRPPQLPALNVCLQVNVSGESSKSGCTPGDVLPIAAAVAALPGVVLRGLMAIPEPTGDLSLLAHRFGQVRDLFLRVKDNLGRGPPAGQAAAGAFDTLSMGMSADLETAIAEGATTVRVGSALFGERAR